MEAVIVNQMTTFREKTMYSGSFFGYDSPADTGLNRKNFLFFSDYNGTYCQFSLSDFSVETVTATDDKQDNDL